MAFKFCHGENIHKQRLSGCIWSVGGGNGLHKKIYSNTERHNGCNLHDNQVVILQNQFSLLGQTDHVLKTSL
jgi:hypothetical protein